MPVPIRRDVIVFPHQASHAHQDHDMAGCPRSGRAARCCSAAWQRRAVSRCGKFLAHHLRRNSARQPVRPVRDGSRWADGDGVKERAAKTAAETGGYVSTHPGAHRRAPAASRRPKRLIFCEAGGDRAEVPRQRSPALVLACDAPILGAATWRAVVAEIDDPSVSRWPPFRTALRPAPTAVRRRRASCRPREPPVKPASTSAFSQVRRQQGSHRQQRHAGRLGLLGQHRRGGRPGDHRSTTSTPGACFFSEDAIRC